MFELAGFYCRLKFDVGLVPNPVLVLLVKSRLCTYTELVDKRFCFKFIPFPYYLRRKLIILPLFPEREWTYELIFSGESSDYIFLPRITDLKDFTACWWLKTELPTGWSTVFSLHNYENESLVSFSYNGGGSYTFQVKNNRR